MKYILFLFHFFVFLAGNSMFWRHELEIYTYTLTIPFTSNIFFLILEENNQYVCAPGSFLLDSVCMYYYMTRVGGARPENMACFRKRDRRGDLSCQVDANHTTIHEQIVGLCLFNC